jgi:hypothetical protein
MGTARTSFLDTMPPGHSLPEIVQPVSCEEGKEKEKWRNVCVPGGLVL